MNKESHENPHHVARGRLGREAKRRANRENGRKGGVVKSRKKTIAARLNARRPRPESPQEATEVVIALIRRRFGDGAIGLGDHGIRFAEPVTDSLYRPFYTA